MQLYCCACLKDVEGKLVGGDTIYPHRPDLKRKQFVQCPECGNYVGAYKGRPLGSIPTKQLRFLRRKVHEVIDPLWQNGFMSRDQLYACLSGLMRKEFHVGEIREPWEADMVMGLITEFRETGTFLRVVNSKEDKDNDEDGRLERPAQPS